MIYRNDVDRAFDLTDTNLTNHSFFVEHMLFQPLYVGADKLKIVSGYASPSMASWHITEIYERHLAPIEISLIVGMYNNDGLSTMNHEGFKEVMNDYRFVTNKHSSFSCQYVVEGSPVHSKIYIWERKGTPLKAYMGSANYSQVAFSQYRREILQECDPSQALDYFNTIEVNSMYCNHADIEDYIKISKKIQNFSDEESTLSASVSNSLRLSLLTKKGDMHTRAGLNWGQRHGHNPNQAYIPLPIEYAHSGFFPLEKRQFSVMTDDNKNLILRVEQDNDKAITTPLNNSHIGEYFRNRLGLANGAYVTKQDLLNYGRTDVEFTKIDDEQYFMNFSNTGN